MNIADPEYPNTMILCVALARYFDNTISFQSDHGVPFPNRRHFFDVLRRAASAARTPARKQWGSPHQRMRDNPGKWPLGRLVSAVLRSDAAFSVHQRHAIRHGQQVCLLFADISLHTARNITLISEYGAALRSDIGRLGTGEDE